MFRVTLNDHNDTLAVTKKINVNCGKCPEFFFSWMLHDYGNFPQRLCRNTVITSHRSVSEVLRHMKYECGKCPSVFKQPWPTERVQLLSVKHLGSLSQMVRGLKPYTPPTFIIPATLWSAPHADYPRPALTKHAGKDNSRPSADWFHLINSL